MVSCLPMNYGQNFSDRPGSEYILFLDKTLKTGKDVFLSKNALFSFPDHSFQPGVL